MASERAIVICPVVPYPEVGGGHKRTMRLLEAIEAAGLTPHVLTADGRHQGGVEALRSRGWVVDVVPEPAATPMRRAAQKLRMLPSPYLPAVAVRLSQLVAEGCAFVQAEHTQSAYYRPDDGATPWILSLHNVDSRLMRSVVRARRPGAAWLTSVSHLLALRSVERRALPRSDAVICVSEEDRRELARIARRVVVAPNGVDDVFFDVPAELPENERVLFFGQYDYAPNALGMERFLREGWPLVAAERPAATLRLAGGGMSLALRELVDRTERAAALGFVADLPGELASSKVAIVPIWAGGGTRLKALESLAAARPVVGTPLGMEGIGFEGGAHGELANTPAELGRLTAEVLADQARARRLAAGGRELAERFRWSRVTLPAQRLYRELAQRNVPTNVQA
jgi:glycosyltransferase involved in cell wall biosynthesis